MTAEGIGTLPLLKMVAYPPQRASTRGNRTQRTETWGSSGAPAVEVFLRCCTTSTPTASSRTASSPPVELIRRAHVNGYAAIAVTDHAGAGNLEQRAGGSAPRVRAGQPALADPGPPRRGADPHPGRVRLRPGPAGPRRRGRRWSPCTARRWWSRWSRAPTARPSTARTWTSWPTPACSIREDAARAAARGCFIEVSGRRGHGFANGHVVRTALAAGARLLLDSDAHEPRRTCSPRAFARTVLLRRRPARVRAADGAPGQPPAPPGAAAAPGPADALRTSG